MTMKEEFKNNTIEEIVTILQEKDNLSDDDMFLLTALKIYIEHKRAFEELSK